MLRFTEMTKRYIQLRIIYDQEQNIFLSDICLYPEELMFTPPKNSSWTYNLRSETWTVFLTTVFVNVFLTVLELSI